MRMPRPFPPLAGLALALGVVAARLPAAEPADPYALLPRCPDDAAAISLQQRVVGTPLTLSNEIRVDTGPFSVEGGALDVVGDTDGDVIKLSDRVVIAQGDRQLQADEVLINTETRRIDVNGEVEYRQPDLVVHGQTGSFANETAEFEGARFELPQRPARGAASSMSLSNAGVITLNDVRYTTCPEGKADWQIRADSVSINTAKGVGTARDARVEFFGVPLLRLPAISFPVGSARKSGLLFPSIGSSSRGGVQVSVPYYLNIAPQQDFTFTPTWYTSRGIDLEGDYRYLTRRGRHELLANFLPGDDKTGENRSRWRLNSATDLSDSWRLSFNGENVSDARYFEDFAQGADGASIAFLPRAARLAYRDTWLDAGVLVRNFQTLDQDLPQTDRPHTEAPRFYANGDWQLTGNLPLDYGFNLEAVNFRHAEDVQGWRLDAAPRVGLDYSGAGYFFRPTAMFEATSYRLRDTAPGIDESPSRALPLFSVDTGLLFERESGSRGQRRMTLEPRLMYLYAPYRDQADLPLFDTAEPDLNWIQLFRPNRYVGLDRISDANQVSFGVTTQVYSSRSGTRFLSTTIGQTYHFNSPRVRLPDEPAASGSASDLIAQVELSAFRNWSISTGMQYDPYEDRTERAEVRLQYRPEPRSVMNLGYRFQRDRLEQVEGSIAWPVFGNWRLYGRGLYSLREDQSIEKMAGFEYSSCCWNFRAVARDYVSRRSGERDRSIYVQLELKGLSNVGLAADAFLEKAIRGYSTRR